MPTPKEISSVLSGANAEFLEALYQTYLTQPEQLSPEWAAYFAALPAESAAAGDANGSQPAGSANGLSGGGGDALSAGGGQEALPPQLLGHLDQQAAVFQMVTHIRRLGHTHAQLDPLGRPHMPDAPDLLLERYGLTEQDLDTTFSSEMIYGAPNRATLREIRECLTNTYCGSVGAEYLHIRQHERRNWLLERMERCQNTPPVDAATKGWILTHLTHAEVFEKFLHTKFVGQKRFSLEGAESLMVLLNGLVDEGARLGVEEVVFGMPHRGRLNTLLNVIQKAPEEIFAEFEDAREINEFTGSGDVKYHKGYSSDVLRQGKQVHLALTFNPSHLEAVNPVVEGNVRAKQDLRGDTERKRIIPVIMHGDAAFAGQGLVMETLNLANLEGYTTGGTIHIIVNNQIGFTTLPRDSRSTVYASDVCKMLNAPVLHVNGDDPEAVLHVVKLAVGYRQTFGADIYIDMYCYRRLGHNEGDEPSFTQPRMYEMIKKLPSTLRLYTDKLLREGVVAESQVREIHDSYRKQLEDALAVERTNGAPDQPLEFAGVWKGVQRNSVEEAVQGTSREALQQIGTALCSQPPEFQLHPRLKRLIDSRKSMVAGERALDWGMGELLAYGSLLWEGLHVRLSGQDCLRGTFSHRHAGFVELSSPQPYLPLQHLKAGQGRFAIYNSPLSEAGVLGFEYGYSLADPSCLVIWEAQFGDFANGAQVIIDQFMSCAEHKWMRMSGLVLLLPHGFEGQGAEHSSARLERYLQLCAENNMQVINPTTPAQFFHMLRRQMHRTSRKPLIVMSPKSLLRHPRAVSSLAELEQGRFQKVICGSVAQPQEVRRAVLCSGKVYYDLLAELEKCADDARQRIALIRVEQLYPFAEREILDTLQPFGGLQEVVWVQEEPQNMGSWHYIDPLLRACLPQALRQVRYVGRKAAAAAAVGSHSAHNREQQELLTQALNG